MKFNDLDITILLSLSILFKKPIQPTRRDIAIKKWIIESVCQSEAQIEAGIWIDSGNG